MSSYEGLAAVLKLSSRWGLSSVRRFALRRLDEIVQPVQRLALARSCNVERWLSRALVALCERPEPLVLDDILQMTPEDTALVTQVREQSRAPASPVTPKTSDVTRLIDDLSPGIRMRRQKLGGKLSTVKGHLFDDENSTAVHEHHLSPSSAAPSTYEGVQPAVPATSTQPTFVFGRPLSVTPGDRPFTPDLPAPASGSDSGNEDWQYTIEKAKLEIKSPQSGKPLPFKRKRRVRGADDKSSQHSFVLSAASTTVLAATSPAT